MRGVQKRKEPKRQNTCAAKQPTTAAVHAGLENPQYQILRGPETFGTMSPPGTPPVTRRDPIHPGETDPLAATSATISATSGSDLPERASRRPGRTPPGRPPNPQPRHPATRRLAGEFSQVKPNMTPQCDPLRTSAYS